MRLLFKSYNILRHISRKMSNQESLVAVCQMTAKNDKSTNLATCRNLLEKASQHGAKMVFFPEACDFIGESKSETLKMAEPLDGPLVSEYRNLAKHFKVWISLGGIHEKATDERIRNSHIVIDSEGNIVTVYRKAHLFDVELPDKNVRLKESDYVEPGNCIIPPVISPVGNIGLCVCYDMRFGEMGIALRGMGAEILTFPSAFTQSTGASHWEVLLRARAIETQCYVIAAAQTGMHNLKRSSWGHAMIVDPWGTVIAQCSEGNTIALGIIDPSNIRRVRTNMPVWEHRRFDLYQSFTGNGERLPNIEMEKQLHKFGESVVKKDQIFYETVYSIAFTNKRCILPGHVLVAPKRCAERLGNLSKAEVSDLFLAVTNVQKIVEKCYLASASTVSIQDGEEAGQTVKHVHVHILPRKVGDFNRNDEIYPALEQHDKVGEDRLETDMFKEAEMLRNILSS